MSEGNVNALLSYNSVTLVALLLLSSWSSAIVSAEDVSNAIEGEVSWPQSGSVDSGWIELSTTEGNDPSIITQASADWKL